jgi:5-methylcytosine-specific restriction enzyme A
MAVAWADFYKSAGWKRLRKLQLREHPLWKFCLERGLVERATGVGHVEPHRGDWTKFLIGKLQSLGEPCQKKTKREIELYGYRCDIGLDAYPTDPNHPFNRGF